MNVMGDLVNLVFFDAVDDGLIKRRVIRRGVDLDMTPTKARAQFDGAFTHSIINVQFAIVDAIQKKLPQRNA